MLINGVVFDLDHTLFDRYATLTECAKDFCDILKDYAAVDASTMAKLLCEGDKKYIYHGWRKIFEHLCDNGAFKPVPEYAQYKAALLKTFTMHAVPYPFTYSVLTKLHNMGYKTGLITNGDASIQASKLELLHLNGYFDEIILCGEFGVQKPNAAPFNEMARRLGVPENNLLYVGDNPINDVGGSRAAGYIPVEVLTADCPMEEAIPAKYRINSVAELFELMEVISND